MVRPTDPRGGSGWPAPDVGNELRVDRGELKKIAERLQDDLDTYSSDQPGTLNDLRSSGNITIQQLGNYPAAHGYQQSLMAASQNIGQTYQKFLLAYQGVIEAIMQSAGHYDAAERNNESNFSRSELQAGSVQPRAHDVQSWD